MFECIDADRVRYASKHTEGSAGALGGNYQGWKRICCAFKTASDELCHSIAILANHLWSEHVQPEGLARLLACRVIELSKTNWGLWGCQIDNSKSIIIFMMKGAFKEAITLCQLCGGKITGAEAAIHSMRELFKMVSLKPCYSLMLVWLLIASTNRLSLQKIMKLFPHFSTMLANMYCESSELPLDPHTLH